MTEAAEFSRIVRVDNLPGRGMRQHISADRQERAALAERFGLAGLESLEADFVLTRSGRGARVRGEARAKATQTCIVTLEPFDVEIVEEVDVQFAPAANSPKPRQGEEQEIRLDAEDEPDPLVDGRIDIGELAAEFISLGLDPYPRKPGVEFETPEPDGDKEEAPFASLAQLRPKREGE